MMKTLLVRGMLAGLVAGVLAAGFAYLVGEPPVSDAIALEESHGTQAHDPASHDAVSHDAPPHAESPGRAGSGDAAAHEHSESPDHAAESDAAPGHDHGDDALVGRGVQSTLGLLTGVTGYAVAVGGLFAIAFAVVQGRVTTLRPRVSVALLAAGGFAVAVLVPFLKYPANPPAVGQAGTIEDRTALYFGFLALSVVTAMVAVAVGRAAADRAGAASGGLLGVGVYVTVMAVAGALLPAVDEVPDGFPGSLLWDFRLASLGTQVVLWCALGLVFAMLAEKALGRGSRDGHAVTVRQ
ncbi:putative cobalt transporter CbtA [Prauserella sediminis]|uniref:Putative cobalt transporter CbtA n=1 Tax=Prauserella sediminis TaxID=577680 RepID=A0A839XIZ4_9PSEU|nr:CbtA family protein [Prauserella sediminis]MBB3661534.1 putative cobalt transporter CbtA [Prauserella sediminis]